jgi:hypothetical protein
MACITTCSKCGRCYQEISEEEANAPDRKCANCFQPQPLHAEEVKA